MSAPEEKPYATTIPSLQDVPGFVGRELGLTGWLEIDQDQIDAFASVTGDHQWIHTRPELARTHAPYGGTIAHGYLVLSLASRFVFETYTIEDVGFGLNYGLNRVRFPNAVKVGARIRGRVKLSGFAEIEGGARLELEVVMEIEGEEKPACVAELIGQVYRAPDRKTAALARQLSEHTGTDEPAVLYERQAAVAIITLNRPARYNGVNFELNEGLKQALLRAGQEAEVRAVVLRGAGKGFCAGADMEVLAMDYSPAARSEYIVQTYGSLMRMFTNLRKPVIGAIHGSAAGVGCALALACDLRIMADTANLRYAFINVGLGPDGGAGWFLTRQVGYSRAFEIAVEGEKIPAERCLELGLTNRVVPEAKLQEAALQWARKLAERPTLAVGITKADLHHAVNHSLHENIEKEAREQILAFESDDLREGVSAFLQKRKPKFEGK